MTWQNILRNPTFWAYALLQAGTYAGLFVFLISSSFVFIRVLGVSPTVYGLLMFSMSASFILGTLLCRRLLLRLSVTRTVAIGGGISLVGGTLLGVLSLMEVKGLLAIMLPVYLFILAHGINQPCSQSGVMGPFPRAAGAASAWSSFIMVLVAFGIGHVLGKYMGESVYPMTLGMWACGVFIASIAWVLVPFAARKPVVR